MARINLPTGAFGFRTAGPGAKPLAPAGTPTDPMAGLIAALKSLQPSLPPPTGALGSTVPNLAAPTPQPGPVTPQFDPAAPFNQPATPGVLPGLNTGGVNPYLSDPLMSSYYRLQNPLYANQSQQDFYGDPELFNAPTVAGG